MARFTSRILFLSLLAAFIVPSPIGSTGNRAGMIRDKAFVGCKTIIVGRKTADDGSALMAHSQDDGDNDSMHVVYHPPQEVDQSPLPRLLEAAAEYCRRFGNASLDYVCLEEVTEVSYSPYRVVPWSPGNPVVLEIVNHFLYDYQLLMTAGKIQEKRILLEENGKKKHVPDAPLKVKRFPYHHIILGPMLVSEAWQPLHDYRIIGREKAIEESCLVLEAVPKQGVETDHLFGRIWVSERDDQLLKFEWNQKSIGNYEKIEKIAKKLRANPRITIVMEYAHMKNGIRFPSKYVLSEEYVRKGARVIGSVTTVLYRDYKFFTVETKVDLKKGG